MRPMVGGPKPDTAAVAQALPWAYLEEPFSSLGGFITTPPFHFAIEEYT
jgi:hypothetical protein